MVLLAGSFGATVAYIRLTQTDLHFENNLNMNPSIVSPDEPAVE